MRKGANASVYAQAAGRMLKQHAAKAGVRRAPTVAKVQAGKLPQGGQKKPQRY